MADQRPILELLDELDRLHGEATPGDWRVVQGVTQLEIKAPHQQERNVARVFCDIDADWVSAIHNAYPRFAELVRSLIRQRDQLKAALAPITRDALNAANEARDYGSVLDSVCALLGDCTEAEVIGKVEALAAERDQLRAEVERLTAENAELQEKYTGAAEAVRRVFG